jgi:hypothetical protein
LLGATYEHPSGTVGMLEQTQEQLRPLVQLALRGLPAMFYPERQLFCYRLQQTANGLKKDGISPRYTMMTLMGLHRAKLAGFESPVDCESILDGLVGNLDWIDNSGDLGLLLWLAALQCPERVSELIVRADLGHVLNRYPDVRERRTMELAWVLAGLAHVKLAGVAGSDQWSRLAERTFSLLKANQGASGAFCHLAPGWAGAGRLRGGIGSFADQVYPIYACSKYAAAYGSEEALQAAQAGAEIICREQGALGQWWWHYEARSGRAVGKYPVYSVHQDGMGPLALFALAEASGLDFEEPIYRGLRWIWRENELGINLCDDQDAVIWRCIRPAQYRKYSSEMLALLHIPVSPGPLHVLYESRSYHLGWLLYAFAGRGDAWATANRTSELP